MPNLKKLSLRRIVLDEQFFEFLPSNALTELKLRSERFVFNDASVMVRINVLTSLKRLTVNEMYPNVLGYIIEGDCRICDI